MWLSRHQLLWTQDGIVAGAGWLDVHLLLPLRSVGAIALLVLAFVVLPSPFYESSSPSVTADPGLYCCGVVRPGDGVVSV